MCLWTLRGFEPSTSRMQSVRATTVPSAHTSRCACQSQKLSYCGCMEEQDETREQLRRDS